MTSPTHEHILRSQDHDRDQVNAAIVRMGRMAAAQLEAALDATARRDDKAATRVVANDPALDALERDIGHDVMRMALRGPMARDLRELLAALRIASDIERIGDYAANIAKRSIALDQSPPLAEVGGVVALGLRAVRQVRAVVNAFATADVVAAQGVREADVDIDSAYTTLYRDILDAMRAADGGHPAHLAACTHLLFMAKNIERIGDHATNIAENVCYLELGEDALPPREKGDLSSTLA